MIVQEENLYIQIKDGKPWKHPMLESNVVDIVPGIDLYNLPSNYARFIRTKKPILGQFDVYEGNEYIWDGDDIREIHHVRIMTEEEKEEKKQSILDDWVSSGQAAIHPSWVFNENTFEYDPPALYPRDGNMYSWDESSISWVIRDTE